MALAMAAAMLAHASGASLDATEIAATIALEHHLGMSCDPVGGFVLIIVGLASTFSLPFLVAGGLAFVPGFYASFAYVQIAR
mgnify:CR=1 FL=1